MRVFIGWSEERSNLLATKLYKWLPQILQICEPWMSAHDINAGDRWFASVEKELENLNFGILCLTPENVNSSWILFEAGALSKHINSSQVVPLLLDIEIRDLVGPLSQFQAIKADESGLRDIVFSINKLSENKIDDAIVNKTFNFFWPEFKSYLDSIPKPKVADKPTRSTGEILEEVVTTMRALQSPQHELDSLKILLKTLSNQIDSIRHDMMTSRIPDHLKVNKYKSFDFKDYITSRILTFASKASFDIASIQHSITQSGHVYDINIVQDNNPDYLLRRANFISDLETISRDKQVRGPLIFHILPLIAENGATGLGQVVVGPGEK